MKVVAKILIIVFLIVGATHSVMAGGSHFAFQMEQIMTACDGENVACQSAPHGAKTNSCVDSCLKARGLGLGEAILPVGLVFGPLLFVVLILALFLLKFSALIFRYFDAGVFKLLFNYRLLTVALRN